MDEFVRKGLKRKRYCLRASKARGDSWPRGFIGLRRRDPLQSELMGDKSVKEIVKRKMIFLT